MKILKGNALLKDKALYREGKVYLPAEVLDDFIGVWGQETVFYQSPLAGKRICITVLSPDIYADDLPAALEHFLGLCSAAGAEIIYHDGGVFPTGDLMLAIEPGGRHIFVNYLGVAFRSKPLAQRMAYNIKKGLRLAYLPDPVAFSKPQYNLKINFWSKISTPAIYLQWPEKQNDIALWLFASILEYFGDGQEVPGKIFDKPKPVHEPKPAKPEPEPNEEIPQLEPKPFIEPLPETDVQPDTVEPQTNQGNDSSDKLSPGTEEKNDDHTQSSKIVQRKVRETSEKPGYEKKSKITKEKNDIRQTSTQDRVYSATASSALSAAMSKAQYPEFFAMLEKRKKQPIKKQPFK